MSGRRLLSAKAKYGFNGKPKDNEDYGEGNAYDFGARIYDSRLGKWLSLDPLAKRYPSMSPYTSFNDNPVLYIDPDGKDGRVSITTMGNTTNIVYETTIQVYGQQATNADVAAYNKYASEIAGGTKTFNIDGKTYNVTIKINFTNVNAKALETMAQANGYNKPGENNPMTASSSGVDKTKLQGFKEGDNLMEVNLGKNLGVSADVSGLGVSGAQVGAGATPKTYVHTALHTLGFNEAYNQGSGLPAVQGFEGDVMRQYEGWPDDTKTNAYHYENLINYVVKNVIEPATQQAVYGPKIETSVPNSGANKSSEAKEVK